MGTDPIFVMPYLGYGTRERVRLCGRVLRGRPMPPATDRDRRWHNLVAFYKHLESDEVPGARLRLCLQKRTIEAVTDREGYFDAAIDGLSLEPGWHSVQLALAGTTARALGRVLVPSLQAQFAVVSDLDDTVVQSNVANKMRMVLALALSNARTRKPFPGVASFYRALHAGVNPLFYVSKSPWNLYAPLVEFLKHQRLPEGPLVLRDFGWRMNRRHKTEAIDAILRTYSSLPFVLIGDSAEEDPQIYSELVERFPERIRTIYIRSVNPGRIAEIRRLAKKMASTGAQLVLAPDSEFAAAHAAAEGLIASDALGAISREKQLD